MRRKRKGGRWVPPGGAMPDVRLNEGDARQSFELRAALLAGRSLVFLPGSSTVARVRLVVEEFRSVPVEFSQLQTVGVPSLLTSLLVMSRNASARREAAALAAPRWCRIGPAEAFVNEHDLTVWGYSWGWTTWEFPALRDIFVDEVGCVLVPHAGVMARFRLAEPLLFCTMLRALAFGDPVRRPVEREVRESGSGLGSVSLSLN